ncbi:SpoIIIAH-like family protein [Clostridium sp. SHJSY1]|uniref:SpoIIIAH-like family protein n=1 Tax=Clostridium sp. SHJSY1 TaxID=2942483 RepID=UPI00287410A3|nr:SpoIIIAH-like family protein [Clostridium sp. SHJSY1]MDS0527336.1 SpoIIIAH-like family protein [Clostridium sp. SHJSY1]
MTKKQLGIICTLLALIVCTALLAAKLNNGGFNDPSDLSAALLTDDNNKTDNEENKDAETLSQTDFFIDARSEREQKDAATIQSLKTIADGTNTTTEQKASATSELQKVTLKQDKQKTIELNLKNKGYDDAICDISDDQKKASVIVKTTNSVTEKAGAEIQEIVQNASNIKDVSIEVKK